MTRYLIFNNRPSSGKFNEPGSPEDIACDIARVIENEGNSKKRFISYPAKSTDATFASLKEEPRFAVELNQMKINAWINDALPLLAKINNLNDIIDQAYGDIMQAVTDLDNDLQESSVCHDLDLISDMGINYGFESISRPNEYDFSERIVQYFDVEIFEYHLDGRS